MCYCEVQLTIYEWVCLSVCARVCKFVIVLYLKHVKIEIAKQSLISCWLNRLFFFHFWKIISISLQFPQRRANGVQYIFRFAVGDSIPQIALVAAPNTKKESKEKGKFRI